MRISFDLDDTLICYHDGAACEPNRVPWLLRGWFPEPLRHGARGLLRELARRGWEVWVYTTSYRSPSAVRWWLWWYGIRVGRVINQAVHDRHLRRTPRDYPPSKNPAAFGIDLHVDDSEGVALEGREHGFDVVVIAPDDLDWVEKVLAAVERRGARPG
jgi:hypothetical protein